jgi:hypothetical protein
MREPYADRFRLILNDLGAGFAARGDELEEIVERSNPALRQTNRVLAILARQNRALAELARDSDTVLAPLARERRQITGFIRGSSDTAQATAERAADLEAGFELFPRYLRELRKTSTGLRRFADAGTPVITDLGAAAPSVNRAQRALGPLAEAGIPALKTLGDAAKQSQDDIVASDPVIKDVRDLARSADPGAKQLDKLMQSLDHAICVEFELVEDVSRCVRTTTGFESLMDFIFGTSAATNGFDAFGHYLRTFGLVTNCTQIISTPVGGCSSKFTTSDETTTRASESDADARKTRNRPKESRRRLGTATGSTESERSAPAPQEPETPTAPPLDGDGQSELAPPAEAGASGRSTRGARTLLRFLMEDGS